MDAPMHVAFREAEAEKRTAEAAGAPKAKIEVEHLNAWFGSSLAIKDVSIQVPEHSVLAVIGPSGCGKSTFLRCLNRMHELVPGARAEGEVLLDGAGPLRRRRRPGAAAPPGRHGLPAAQPLPHHVDLRQRGRRASRSTGIGGDHDAIVERCLRQAALWDEVKDRLRRERARALRRPAAAALHRPGPGGRAGGAAHGRAGERPRPHRHRQDRGAHPRAARSGTPSSS